MNRKLKEAYKRVLVNKISSLRESHQLNEGLGRFLRGVISRMPKYKDPLSGIARYQTEGSRLMRLVGDTLYDGADPVSKELGLLLRRVGDDIKVMHPGIFKKGSQNIDIYIRTGDHSGVYIKQLRQVPRYNDRGELVATDTFEDWYYIADENGTLIPSDGPPDFAPIGDEIKPTAKPFNVDPANPSSPFTPRPPSSNPSVVDPSVNPEDLVDPNITPPTSPGQGSQPRIDDDPRLF